MVHWYPCFNTIFETISNQGSIIEMVMDDFVMAIQLGGVTLEKK